MSTLLLFSLFSFLVFFFFMGIRVVSQQTIKIVETFGKYSRILTPGINFIFYPIQAIAGTVSLKIETIKAVVEIKTSDNMFVKLPIDLMVSVNPDKANDAFYRLQDPHAQISSWVLNTVRSTAATMTLEEMYQDKETIVASVRGTLSAKLDEFGYKIENVLVDQPTVTIEVQESFNRVVAAKRGREAAEQEGEGKKILMVKQAEAEAEAQEKRAQGLANSRKILAEGLAKSLDEFKNLSAADSIEMLLATNRIDAIRDVGKHGNLILIDLNGDASNKALLPLLSGLPRKPLPEQAES